MDATVSRTKRNTRRVGWCSADCGGLGGIPESGGNVIGSGRDSLTFQVGNRILVPRRVFGVLSLDIEGRGGSVATGDGGDIEKNAASEI